MTKLRMTLVFEKIDSEGAVVDKATYGAFVGQPNNTDAVARVAFNTVIALLPKFLRKDVLK